jgi:hypothetical protein
VIRPLAEAREEAASFLVFLEGAEDGGGIDAGPELRRRSRLLAQLTLDLLNELESERSSRVAIQAHRDKLLNIVGGAAYIALGERLRGEAK